MSFLYVLFGDRKNLGQVKITLKKKNLLSVSYWKWLAVSLSLLQNMVSVIVGTLPFYQETLAQLCLNHSSLDIYRSECQLCLELI